MKFKLFVLTITAALTCAAQAPPPAPLSAKPAPATLPVIKFHGITISGSLRSRIEGWDWFQPSSGDNSYAYSGNLFRLSLAQRKETWDWNAEFGVPFILGLPANPVAPAPQAALGFGANYLTSNDRNQNTAMIFPKQLYIRITQFGGSKAHMLKLGRFEFLDGSESAPANATLANLKANRINQRLIGAFQWTDIGRSFDGVQYTYSKKAGTLAFVGAMPTRGVFQTDGWGWNNVGFGYSSLTKPWGSGAHKAETRVLALYYDDWRSVLKTDNRPASLRAAEFSNIKIWTAGGNSIHAIDTKAGTLDAVVWGVMQTGQWGNQRQEAYAFDVEGGFQPKILPKLKPWLRGGYSVTSGDGNATDGTHGTFFQVLPTPRPYARFPFFNMMNNIDRFGALTLRPHTKITTTSEFHSLSLQNSNDLWYVGGGAYQPWSFGYVGRNTSGKKSLANLYDTQVEYRFNPRFTFLVYYGYAQGLAAMNAIYPAGKDGSFGYGEVLVRF